MTILNYSVIFFFKLKKYDSIWISIMYYCVFWVSFWIYIFIFITFSNDIIIIIIKQNDIIIRFEWILVSGFKFQKQKQKNDKINLLIFKISVWFIGWINILNIFKLFFLSFFLVGWFNYFILVPNSKFRMMMMIIKMEIFFFYVQTTSRAFLLVGFPF